jgi:hypothetical protein
MIDRERILAVLRRCFPNASDDVVESAAIQIGGLEDDWREVTSKEGEMGYHYSARCVNICYLADQVDRGAEYRLFLKRRPRS